MSWPRISVGSSGPAASHALRRTRVAPGIAGTCWRTARGTRAGGRRHAVWTESGASVASSNTTVSAQTATRASSANSAVASTRTAPGSSRSSSSSTSTASPRASASPRARAAGLPWLGSWRKDRTPGVAATTSGVPSVLPSSTTTISQGHVCAAADASARPSSPARLKVHTRIVTSGPPPADAPARPSTAAPDPGPPGPHARSGPRIASAGPSPRGWSPSRASTAAHAAGLPADAHTAVRPATCRHAAVQPSSSKPSPTRAGASRRARAIRIRSSSERGRKPYERLMASSPPPPPPPPPSPPATRPAGTAPPPARTRPARPRRPPPA